MYMIAVRMLWESRLRTLSQDIRRSLRAFWATRWLFSCLLPASVLSLFFVQTFIQDAAVITAHLQRSAFIHGSDGPSQSESVRTRTTCLHIMPVSHIWHHLLNCRITGKEKQNHSYLLLRPNEQILRISLVQRMFLSSLILQTGKTVYRYCVTTRGMFSLPLAWSARQPTPHQLVIISMFPLRLLKRCDQLQLEQCRESNWTANDAFFPRWTRNFSFRFAWRSTEFMMTKFKCRKTGWFESWSMSTHACTHSCSVCRCFERERLFAQNLQASQKSLQERRVSFHVPS